MSEPTKEALELAERIKERAMVPTGVVQFTRFDQATAATVIDAHTASLREELRAAREALESLCNAVEWPTPPANLFEIAASGRKVLARAATQELSARNEPSACNGGVRAAEPAAAV